MADHIMLASSSRFPLRAFLQPLVRSSTRVPFKYDMPATLMDFLLTSRTWCSLRGIPSKDQRCPALAGTGCLVAGLNELAPELNVCSSGNHSPDWNTPGNTLADKRVSGFQAAEDIPADAVEKIRYRPREFCLRAPLPAPGCAEIAAQFDSSGHLMFKTGSLNLD